MEKCGKSKTIDLFERLYESTEGEIIIDGVNLKEYDLITHDLNCLYLTRTCFI